MSELFSGILGLASQFLFDAQQLVVFGKAFGTAGSTRFDFSGSQANHQISNEGIFGLSRSVRDHHTPACSLRIVAGFNGFCDSANLIDLEQESVTGLFLYRRLDTLRIGDQQVISYNLSGLANFSS